MQPRELLGTARAPDGTVLTLTRHPTEYVIAADGQALMSSRMHASEDALAVLGCRDARTLDRPCVLVGGLGMGFTLRAALDILPSSASVIVAELIHDVVEWNRGPLGALAGQPLADSRVRVVTGDVAETIRGARDRFDAVLLDVDNGPVALTALGNARLYDAAGLAVARASLRPGGTLAVWSAREERAFERRLRAAGFAVSRERVRGRPNARGPRHTILLARRTDAPAPRRRRA